MARPATASNLEAREPYQQAIAAYVIAFSFALALSDNIWGDDGSAAWASRLVLAAGAGVTAILAIASRRRFRPEQKSGA